MTTWCPNTEPRCITALAGPLTCLRRLNLKDLLSRSFLLFAGPFSPSSFFCPDERDHSGKFFTSRSFTFSCNDESDTDSFFAYCCYHLLPHFQPLCGRDVPRVVLVTISRLLAFSSLPITWFVFSDPLREFLHCLSSSLLLRYCIDAARPPSSHTKQSSRLFPSFPSSLTDSLKPFFLHILL